MSSISSEHGRILGRLEVQEMRSDRDLEILKKIKNIYYVFIALRVFLAVTWLTVYRRLRVIEALLKREFEDGAKHSLMIFDSLILMGRAILAPEAFRQNPEFL